MKLNPVSIRERFDLVPVVIQTAIKKLGLEDRISVVEIDPNIADTAAFCEQYEWPLEQSANCVVVEAKRGEKKWKAACMVLGTTRADINGLVRQHLDAKRVSMAPMEETLAEAQMEYGGITPIGLPEEWPILIDSTIIPLEQVVIGGGNRSSKLIVSGEILKNLPNAVVLENLGRSI